MKIFDDTALIISVINILYLIGNVYYTFKIKETQASTSLITYWKNKYDVIENRLETAIEKKANLKRQYTQLLAEHKKLEGEIKTYKEFHKHE